MLPGFNHNIRYRDRVFHVQTEDGGLQAPRLVTQVFIDGRIIAHEKSSYAEVLAEGLGDHARNERIRGLMQGQHKRLMKSLVEGRFDDRIAGALEPTPPRSAERPLLAVAPSSSSAAAPVSSPAALVDDLAIDSRGAPASSPSFIARLDEALPPALELGPLPDLSDTAELPPPVPRAEPRAEPHASSPPGRPRLTPAPPPAAPAPAPGGALASARKAASAAPSRARPAAPSAAASAPRAGAAPGARPRGAGFAAAAGPPGDTLVDQRLPAGLRDSLEAARRQAIAAQQGQAPAPDPGASGAHQSLAETARKQSAARVAQFRKRAPGHASPEASEEEQADTVLEIDQAGLKRELARQAQLRAARSAQPQRPDIVVVERSLDEVILGYLADED